MAVLMEWRQWPDGWSFTGTAGTNIPDRIRRPNTQLFPPGVDPNTINTAKPPNLDWHRARIAHAHRIVPRLMHNPAYRSLIAEFKATIDESLNVIANANQDSCEDF